MKEFGPVKQILSMKISHENGWLWLSHKNYIEKVFERFNMSMGKALCSPLIGHFKLSSKQCSTSDKDIKELIIVP